MKTVTLLLIHVTVLLLCVWWASIMYHGIVAIWPKLGGDARYILQQLLEFTCGIAYLYHLHDYAKRWGS
jgi:hypothetical protein